MSTVINDHANTNNESGLKRDVITPREEPNVGIATRLLRRVIPVLDSPAAEHERFPLSRNQSFTDDLPWVDYDPDYKQIVFEDNKTVMACYNLVPIATEGRSLPLLRRIVQDLVPLVDQVIPEHKIDPWVMSIYGNMEERIDPAIIDRMRDYASQSAKGTQYTKTYLERMKQHYEDVTKEGGYFHDDLVSDSPWGGKTQQIRLVIYRRYCRSKPIDDTSDELDMVCGKLENIFKSLNIKASKMDGRGFYTWMRDWFNQRPSICGGDPAQLDEVAPWPGDLNGDDDLPFSFDMGEAVTLSSPEIDDETGVWYLDGLPNVVLQTESVVSVPKPGALTGEVERDEKRFTTIEKMPSNTTVVLTILFRPREQILGEIAIVRDSARGDSVTARATVQEAHNILDFQEDSKEPLYPCELAFYIRGENYRDLQERVSEAQTVLLKAGIKTYDPFMQSDPVRKGNFIRNLPGVYKASIDEKAARRARLIHANHIVRLAPIFGRSRGTGNPGMAMFNRSGEVLLVDLLSKDDSQLNGHTFIYGSSGSGKSAINITFIDSLMAMHRPRVYIIDLGNSFGPYAEYAESQGVSTHVVRLNMDSNVSLPPFADALQLVGAANVHPDEIRDDKDDEEMDIFASGGADVDEAPHRDILGELEIVARQMIQGPDGSPIESPTLKVVIRRAIKLAAERAVEGKLDSKIPRPSDIADCIKEIGQEPEYSSRVDDILDMSSAMTLFCDGLNGHLFNKDGQPWPDVDLTVLDMAQAGQSGRTDTLVIAIISLVMHVNQVAEKEQYSGRPILFMVDEGHMITSQELLMTLMIKITKMWRKLGARFWLATQEIDDIPQAVKRMIGMMEYWVSMQIPKQQLELTKEFRTITPEQAAMMGQCSMSRRKYSEGCILSGTKVLQFRSVPPSLTLALAATGPEEKKQRADVMREHGLTELEANHYISNEIRDARLASSMDKKKQRASA